MNKSYVLLLSKVDTKILILTFFVRGGLSKAELDISLLASSKAYEQQQKKIVVSAVEFL